MKKFISILCFVLLAVIYSCGGGSTSGDKESSDEASEKVQSGKSSKEKGEAIADCDDYLDQYEKWIILYIEALKEYKENPHDNKTLMKFSEAMSEAPRWAEEWINLHACAYNEKYQKRFEEIANKANKAMEELNFE